MTTKVGRSSVYTFTVLIYCSIALSFACFTHASWHLRRLDLLAFLHTVLACSDRVYTARFTCSKVSFQQHHRVILSHACLQSTLRLQAAVCSLRLLTQTHLAMLGPFDFLTSLWTESNGRDWTRSCIRKASQLLWPSVRQMRNDVLHFLLFNRGILTVSPLLFPLRRPCNVAILLAQSTISARSDSVIASNRDEYLSRSTAPASWHCLPAPKKFRSSPETASLAVPLDATQQVSEPSLARPILCGIDAHPSGGGTWLGITKQGKWGALTNFTESSPPPLPQGRQGLTQYRSRGELVKDWLLSYPELSLEEYVNQVARSRNEFPGFNILLGELPSSGSGAKSAGKLYYVTNRNQTGDSPEDALRPGPDGMPGGVEVLLGHKSDMPHALLCTRSSATKNVCGLSNSVLHEPWDKVKSGSQAFEEAVRSAGANDAQLIDALFQVISKVSVDKVEEKDIQNTVLVPPLRLPLKDLAIHKQTSAVLPLESGVRSQQGWQHKIDSAAPAGSTALSKNGHDGQQAVGTAAVASTKVGEVFAKSTGWYATRTSTIILVKPSAISTKVIFVERDIYILASDGSEPQRAALSDPASRRRHQRQFDFEIGHAVS